MKESRKGKMFYYILATLVLIIAGFLYVCAKPDMIIWVAGKHSISCYPQGYEHQNIKYPVEFTALDKCLRFINVNKD